MYRSFVRNDLVGNKKSAHFKFLKIVYLSKHKFCIVSGIIMDNFQKDKKRVKSIQSFIDGYWETDDKKYQYIYKGEIILFLGPMFSGKSKQLANMMGVARLGGLQTYAIQLSMSDRKEDILKDEQAIKIFDMVKDDRNYILSRSGESFPCNNIEYLLEDDIINDCLNVDVIGIDEGQFCEDLALFCRMMCKLGKTIYVAALNSD